ncbi:hypothetical protein GCM10023321_58850 [Pseudonocardia eucalypti]|uniref:Anti-sigma factor antagonist n=1 Tax=Pseudonocardia eucalypti TaxID=648755 RepID=A0ABP9QSU2_9PSEU
MEDLRVRVRDIVGEALIVYVSGEIDLHTTPTLEAELTRACCRADRQRIVVDLGGVDFLGSVGLAVLASTARLCRCCNVEFRVCNPSRDARRAFQVIGLEGLLSLRPGSAQVGHGDLWVSESGDDARLAGVFGEIAHAFDAEKSPAAVLRAITRAAVRTVPRCDHAGAVSIGTDQGQFSSVVTEASSDAVAEVMDLLQELVGQGPCLDQIRKQKSLLIDDLATDPRWPVFGRRAADEVGVSTMLSFRLSVRKASHAALNLYSRQAGAFDDNAYAKGAILAAHATIALTAARARQTTEQMRAALDSNREIGMAMGILMARGELSQSEAFDLLAGASQRLNVKLRRVAAQVVRTGELDEAALADAAVRSSTIDHHGSR